MTIRILLAALALASPAAAYGQTSQSPSQALSPAPAEDLVRVALDTSAGRIVLALDRARAPVTTANFLHYVETGKLDGESFYRAMPYGGGGGLIQGGITSTRASSPTRSRTSRPARLGSTMSPAPSRSQMPAPAPPSPTSSS